VRFRTGVRALPLGRVTFVSYRVTCATISPPNCALELWHHACPSARPWRPYRAVPSAPP